MICDEGLFYVWNLFKIDLYERQNKGKKVTKVALNKLR